MDPAATLRFVSVNGMRLAYHDVGTGPPLVLIHGGGPGASGWSNYQRNIPALSQSRRLLVVDLPGYGQSDNPPVDEAPLAFYARAVRGLLDALGIGPVDIVGNSLGGGTALQLALQDPDRVRRLVLMGPAGGLALTTPQPTEGLKVLLDYYAPPGPSRPKLEAFLRLMVYDPSALTEDLIAARFAQSLRPEIVARPPLTAATLQRLEPLWRECHRVQHPTLLVWGRDDRVVPLDSAWVLLRQLPDVRLHVLSQCGHWVQWERATEFNRLVEAFLAHA